MNNKEKILAELVEYIDTHSNETLEYGWTINSLAMKSKLKVILNAQPESECPLCGYTYQYVDGTPIPCSQCSFEDLAKEKTRLQRELVKLKILNAQPESEKYVTHAKVCPECKGAWMGETNNEKILTEIEKVVDDWDGNTDLMKPIAEILTAQEGECDVCRDSEKRCWIFTTKGWAKCPKCTPPPPKERCPEPVHPGDRDHNGNK